MKSKFETMYTVAQKSVSRQQFQYSSFGEVTFGRPVIQGTTHAFAWTN
jgi:hypothetical protein